MGRNTLADKRNLIQWFLDSQRLVIPSAEKILRRLLNGDEFLRKIALNSVNTGEDNLLLIAARGAQTEPFYLKINEREIYQVEEALEVLEEEDWDSLHLHLAINKRFFCHTCPYQKKEEEDKLLERRRALTKEMLLQMIDQALDFRDLRAFEVLTGKLKDLEG